ncbi:hypothetical protein ACEPAG_8415 [Sanghuangporus baumii]
MLSLANSDDRKPQTEKKSPSTDRASLRNLIVILLKRCDIHYEGSEQSIAKFEALCIAEASARGYILEDDAALRRTIGTGATIAATSYSHLRDESFKIYIALFTGFVAYLDDLFLSHIDAIREFVSRFVARQPQQIKVLDDFAALLLETPRFHNAVACNIILTSTLDYVSSLLIQYDVLGVPMPTSATEYPVFFRRLSGIGNAFAAFIFPASMPVHSWIFALPDIAYCVCALNDVWSFYKEDLVGEAEENLVWLTVRYRNISVYESLCAIANESVDAHNRTLSALASFPDAYETYCKWAHGYYGFHVESKRYKLQDLGL